MNFKKFTGIIIIALCVSLVSASQAYSDVEINESNFPDENFRKYVRNNFDTNFNLKLDDAEINQVYYIEVPSNGITSLRGIEFFTGLKNLECQENQLTALDVSSNTILEYLDCDNNQLTTLDISKNTALIQLYCRNNQLTALDVSKNTALEYLDCGYNSLTNIDLSKNTALTWLICYNNQLMAFDVSSNTALTYLYCAYNQLTELNVSKNTFLTYLSCNNNQLTELDLSKNTALTYLYCYNNQLTELDVNNNTLLTDLSCSMNQLTELDLSSNTALTDLYCSINQLTNLDVSNNTELNSLNCDNNQLTELDLSSNTALIGLYCSINQLTNLDVSNNTELNSLNCDNNQLTELDLSKNTALTYLSCSYNQLTELDVSSNTALISLYCYDNQLTELDVSNNTALSDLSCFGNCLMALDLSNNTDLNYSYYDQYIDPFLVSQDTDGNYIIDLNKYMSPEQIKNVSNVINAQTYDESTGIIKFASSVNNISYTYDTGNDNIENMTVNLSGFVTSFSKPEIIFDSSLPSAICYEMYDELIQANGTRPINFSIIDGKLPEGLEFERVTAYYSNGDIYDCGNISGIPTETGTFKFTVKASNSLGEDSKDFTLIVSEDQHNPPSINPTYLSECTINQWYAVQVSISGKRPITFSISEGNLPNGVTIDSETGLISGTPTESGIFRFTMKAVNVVSEDTQELTLIVNEQNPTISITTSRYLSYATQNQEYSQTLNAIGETPITWALDEDSSLPSGLSLSPEGVISGTPTESGTFKFVAIASNSSSKVMREFILYVMADSTPQGVTITTSAKLPDAVINTEYNKTLSASGNTPITWALAKKSSLPKGFKLSSSGVISGSSSKTGEYKFTIIASNSEDSDSQEFTLNIKDVPPKIKTGSNLDPGTVGKKFNLSLESEGTNVKWEVVSGTLPDGLKLDSKKGTLSGKIKEMGEFSFTIRASNTADSHSDRTFTITVYQAPKISVKSLPSAAVNKEYNTKVDFSGSALTDVECDNLPAGLSIQVVSGECVISGVPTESGKNSINLTITNQGGSVTKKLSLAVFGIEKASLPEGTTGKKYKGSITVTGIKASDWEVSSGDLPPGLSLSKGKISGKPTQYGSFGFTVKVSADEYFVEESYTIKIYPEDPVFKTKSLPKGKVYEPYSEQVELKADGGAIITWSAEFPDELKDLEIAPETGIISGVPTHIYKKSVLVTATNNFGKSTTKSIKLTITADKPKIAAITIPAGIQGQEYTLSSPLATFTTTAGSEILTWSWTGDVPDGLELTKSGDIIGTPTESGKKFKVTVKVENEAGSKTKTFTLVINPADSASTKDLADSDSESESQESESLAENNNNESESQNESISQEFTENNLILDSAALSLVSNDNVMIAAILPDVEVQESGIYEFTVSLDKSVPENAPLIWHSFPNGQISDLEDDNSAIFFNEDGQEIFNVPEDFCVTVSAWFEAGITYKPVIAVKLIKAQ